MDGSVSGICLKLLLLSQRSTLNTLGKIILSQITKGKVTSSPSLPVLSLVLLLVSAPDAVGL